jgi:acetylornithine/succinyldiaminopimelate/putrescine aminotransferase
MELERQYVMPTYARYPLALRRGKGCYLYGLDNRKYLDLLSGIGVNALGHAHPRITKVIQKQAALLLHTSNLYYHEYTGKLAQRLCEISGLDRVFFTNSGAESMALDNSFHGRTIGAISITGQPKYRKDFEPLLPGPRWIPANDIAALEAAFSERTSGIVIEGIQGEGGIHPMQPEFLRTARRLADRYNALLVFDAIQCGVGRTGQYWSHSLIAPEVKPDVMVTAKPLSCGLPMGVILTNERAAAAIKPGMHGTTFGGNVLSSAVALEFLDILDELLPQINRVGEYFRAGLRDLQARHKFIKEVRGHGLMIGVELDHPGKDYVMQGIEQGVLFNCTHDTVLRFLPPYIVTEKEVDQALKVLGRLFRAYRKPKKTK